MECKPFVLVLLHLFLPEVLSFVQPRRRLSSAPTTIRMSRRAQVVSRLAASSAATVRLGLYTTEHDGKLVGLGRKAPPSVWVVPSGIVNLCRNHRSLRGRVSLAASWAFEGFGAAMSRTGSPECRGKNRAVAEARPGRDGVRHDGEGEWCYAAGNGAGCHWNG